jgi:hypothetical protein
MHKLSAAKHASLLLLIGLWLLELIYVDCARAQNVANPSFESPSVSQLQATNGCIGTQQGSSNPAVTPDGCLFMSSLDGSPFSMWAFHAETISPENDCGVQQNGSALGAPTAPSGKQTGWIRNFCTISQILPLSAGAYTLSFKLAAIIPPGQSEQILVQTEGTSQSYTPTSTLTNSRYRSRIKRSELTRLVSPDVAVVLVPPKMPYFSSMMFPSGDLIRS